MGTATTTQLEARVAQALRAIKSSKDKPYAEEVRERLGDARAPMSPAERSAKAAAIRAMTPKDVPQTDSTEMIRELRDRGHAGR